MYSVYDIRCQVLRAKGVWVDAINFKKSCTVPEQVKIVDEFEIVGINSRLEPSVEAEESAEAPVPTA